jgi:ubiquinone/menaquinone biosynthesis C-methylase UbiE
VALVRGDATRLPFADAAFDAAVSTEAFHWFPDQDAALRELRRVLRPGGRLLLALVSPPFEIVADAFELGMRLVGQPLWWTTPARLAAQVRDAGFAVEGQRRIFRIPGFLLPPTLTVARRPC